MGRRKIKKRPRRGQGSGPASLEQLEQLSPHAQALLLQCLTVNWEHGGDGTVAFDYGNERVFIPDPDTVLGDDCEWFHLHPDLVREFADSIDVLEAAGLINVTRVGP